MKLHGMRSIARALIMVGLSVALIAAPAAILTVSPSVAHAQSNVAHVDAAETAMAEAGEGENGAVETPSMYTIIATIVNFLIFLFIVVKFGGPSLNKAMATRRESLLAEIDEAARLRREAEQELNVYLEKLNGFEKERETLLAEFREIGERERDRLIEKAKDEAQQIVDDAKRLGEREASQAERGIEALLLDRAMEMASSDIERQINPMVQNRLVERSIDSLKSLKAS